jgi:hypothetical protein
MMDRTASTIEHNFFNGQQRAVAAPQFIRSIEASCIIQKVIRTRPRTNNTTNLKIIKQKVHVEMSCSLSKNKSNLDSCFQSSYLLHGSLLAIFFPLRPSFYVMPVVPVSQFVTLVQLCIPCQLIFHSLPHRQTPGIPNAQWLPSYKESLIHGMPHLHPCCKFHKISLF